MLPSTHGAEISVNQALLQAVEGPPVAGPSSTTAQTAARRNYNKKPKKIGPLISYTTGFVPGVYNIKNPAGDYVQRDSNVEVARQVSQAKAKREKQEAEAEKQRLLQEGNGVPEQPLSHTLIIHPGCRNLRIGRASDFYPHELPNCIARPTTDLNRGYVPPVPGSRAKRVAQEMLEDRHVKRRKGVDEGDAEMNVDGGEADWVDPVDTAIGNLREYLRNRLRQNKLVTDWKDSARVAAANQKVKPEPVPEHNDHYRIDWADVEGRKYVIGDEALRIPESSNFKVRYPILHRGLNLREWRSSQLLMDDIAIILEETLRNELSIYPRDYSKYSVILIVPDHGDRIYVEAMTNLILKVMGFKEIAVQQEAYTAIFCAGLSSACVVDIGAQQTSVTCVDEGLPNADTRINLNYGGDDITAALTAMLQRSAFPYRDLDLARSQEWLMMDNLKIKMCTLEEHMVANTPWDFHVVKPEGLTQKSVLRTYDENILAALCFFDTRMIDFEEKRGNDKFAFWNTSEDVDDMLTTAYDEPTGAMRACTAHLLPAASVPAPVVQPLEPTATEDEKGQNGRPAEPTAIAEGPASQPESEQTPVPSQVEPALPADTKPLMPTEAATPAFATAPLPIVPNESASPSPTYDIVYEASKVPLDGAIAASISMCGNENKVKAAASSILLIGGSSALKGLGAFLAERLPPLLRARGILIPEVQIVPPPRNLNPRFVCWKGASVMRNLDSLSDMWIRRDEWEAMGARALKDRCLFL